MTNSFEPSQWGISTDDAPPSDCSGDTTTFTHGVISGVLTFDSSESNTFVDVSFFEDG